MEQTEFDFRHERLSRILTELIELLRTHDEQERWVAWLERDRDRIAGGDRYGLDHLLQAYGGMGSLTDVVLERDNDQLQQMRSQVHEDARALLRALESPR